jgi:hypothetical protein
MITFLERGDIMAFLPGPAIQYFGRFPTDIVMQSTNSFNGGAQTSLPTLSPGQYTFPAQAGGGLYWFHTEPVEVKQIAYSGAGTLTVKKVVTVPVASGVAQSSPPNLGIGPANSSQTTQTITNTVLTSTTVATLTAAAPVFTGCIYLSTNEYLTMSSTGDSGSPTVAVTAHQAEYAADGGG